jgi:hypothetical protein
MAATLQFMVPTYRDVRPTVAYGSPIRYGDTFQQVQVATRRLYQTLR